MARVFLLRVESQGVGRILSRREMGTPEDLAVLLENEVIDVGSTAPAYLESKFPLSVSPTYLVMFRIAVSLPMPLMDLLGEGGILYEGSSPRVRPLWVAVLPGYELQTDQRWLLQKIAAEPVDSLGWRCARCRH